MLDRVEDSWHVVGFNTESDSKLGQGASVNALIRLVSQFLEDFEETVLLSKLFKWLLMES